MSTTPGQRKKSCWNSKSHKAQPVPREIREIRATQEHKAPLVRKVLPVPIMRYAQETR